MKTLIALLLISSISFADSINFGVWTDHSVAGDFNENNQLVAVEINNNVLASFINSYGDQSYLLARKTGISKNISVIAGLSYGYSTDCIHDYCAPVGGYNPEILPFAAISLTAKIKSIEITLIEGVIFRTITLGFTNNKHNL